MPDVTANVHGQILSELDGARRDVIGLRDAKRIKNGYMGFEMAEATLVNCRDAIERVKDREQTARRSSTATCLKL